MNSETATTAERAWRTSPKLFSRHQVIGTGVATWVGGALATQSLVGILCAALLAQVVMLVFWFQRVPKAPADVAHQLWQAAARLVLWVALAGGLILAYFLT